MAVVVASLALHAALASGMHRFCSAGSSLRRSAPLPVQTNPEICTSLTPTADASRRREAGARSISSSPSLRRSAPLPVQTNPGVCTSLTPTADASRRREAGARSVSSSPSLRRSTPLMVQTNPEVWQPHDDEEHPNEAPGTGQPRAEVGASFGLLRGRRLPRRELASEWIDAGVPKWVTLIDEALFVLARHAPCIH